MNTEHLFSFLKEATAPYQAAAAAEELLKQNGFEVFGWTDRWKLHTDKSYLVRPYGSSLFAFRIGHQPLAHLRLAAAHTDFPCLRIKPHALTVLHGYERLNIELYGGMNRSTWLDRPLSLAGKVICRGQDAFHPRICYLDLQRPLLIIPSLAIHMEPKTNTGLTLNPQKDMLPLFSMSSSSEVREMDLLELLASSCRCRPQEILSYELTAYPAEPPCTLGAHKEFISASRLDNMTSVLACLNGLLMGSSHDGISLIALFDHEEVGSRTKQGADSSLLAQVLQRLYLGLGLNQADYLSGLSKAFLLSVDVAHALHPNAPDKNDITNFPVLNGGVVLKTAASQSYAGDGEAIAVVRTLCQDNQIPWQIYVNRSDIRGGSTLGSLVSANLAVRTMDIGIPLLAMHSARELMGSEDQDSLTRLITAYFAN